MQRLSTISTCLVLALAPIARADLTGDVRAALAEKSLARATVGVQIVKLGDAREQDKPLVAIDADRPLIPASNLKVITTAMALETLGTDFKFQTQLLTDGSDVALVGDGDPTFGDSEYLGPRGWTSLTVFEQWAAELKQRGVTRVANVLVDDSIFEASPLLQPNWPTNQAHLAYVPEVCGLNFNANCLDVYGIRNGHVATYRIEPDTKYVDVAGKLTAGSSSTLYLSRVLGTNKIVLKGEINGSNTAKPFRVTIHDPALYGATVLAETLRKNGIEVSGEVQRDRTIRAATTQPSQPTAAKWTLVGVHETPILPVMAQTNKDSINLYAECFGKRAAAKLTGEPGSWKNVAESQRAFMKTVGAPDGDYTFDDGCGLSKENAVAPAAFVATLAYMFHGPDRDAFMNTLSVGGEDGTLAKRFGGALSGRVFGKSGYVDGVSTLNGYLHAKGGAWYAFSVMTNKIPGAQPAKAAQDAIVRAIDAASAE